MPARAARLPLLPLLPDEDARRAPAPRRLLATLLLLGAATISAACGGGDKGGDGAGNGGASGDVGGTIVISVPADPDVLIPPLVSSLQGKQVTDFLFDHLAEIGNDLNTVGDAGFTPRLARKWTWAPDSLSIAFELDPRAKWHDGRPVRAEDVRFTQRMYADPAVASPQAPLVANIDSVQVRDSMTAVVWFKRRYPEQFFDATYQMALVPAHLLKDVKPADLRTSEFARHPVGTGAFRFVRWTPGSLLEVVADTAHYRGRPKLDRVIWTTSPDFTAAATKLFAGEADVFEYLRPENVPELAKHPELKTVRYPGLDYAFLQFNLHDAKRKGAAHPIFGDRALRRALTMAVDRQTLVRSVFDSLAAPALGPVTRAQSTADTTIAQLPFDLAKAKATLDSLGWRDTNGDGVREKGGRPLQFTILTPASSKNRVRLAVLLQAQLKEAGVKVDIEQLEFNAFLDREQKRSFDAVMGAWHVDPSAGGVRQMWGTAGSRGTDGANYGGYESRAFDVAVDSGVEAFDPASARRHYRDAYRTIVEDAPAIWLYELKPMVGVHARLNVPNARADAWWAGLKDWSIPASKRIARDRMGPATATAAPAAGDSAKAAR